VYFFGTTSEKEKCNRYVSHNDEGYKPTEYI